MKRLLLFITFLLPMICLVAQQRGMKPVQVTVEGTTTILYKQSHALLIGVSAYNMGLPPLPGVVGDINRIQAVLEKNGFDVTRVLNPDAAGLQNAFNSFISQYGQDADNRLLIYFAGHGYTKKMSYGEDIGYICPVDAPNPLKDPASFQARAMPMGQIEIYAKQIASKHALFLFDACFSGSIFSTSRAIPEIISYKTTQPVRQFITSGSADETVPDKSIFQSQFIRALNGEADANKDGFLTGTELGDFLQSTVVNYSYGSQHPQYGKIRNPNLDKGDFVFVLNPSTQTGIQVVPAEVPAAPAIKQIAVEEAKIPEADVREKAGTEMVYVEGGTFHMGSSDGEACEKPVHSITLSNFNIGKTEITVGQFKKFIDETAYQTDADKNGGSYIWNGSIWELRGGVNWKCDASGNIRTQSEYNHPVIHVSWNDANEYCKWFSRKTNKTYRLPTEAEWEYAAGGGNKSRGYFYSGSDDIDSIGWYDGNSGSKPHPVGQKQANELGIYDMTGNVWEWCSDRYGANYYKNSPASNPKGSISGDNHVFRGGCWSMSASGCRVSTRGNSDPSDSYDHLGFRLVLVP